VDRLEGRACTACGRRLCGHGAVIAIQLGSKDAPRCPRCLAEALESPREAFLERAISFLARRDCYRSAWLRASAREGEAPMRPACLWTHAQPTDRTDAAQPEADGPPAPTPEPTHWDLGDEGCGDLALALKRRVATVPPGTLVVVHATDPGAAHDIPAWCRLAGHSLIDASPPSYRFRTKP